MRLFHREMECYLVAEGSFADIEEVGVNVVENGKAYPIHAPSQKWQFLRQTHNT